LSWRDLRRRDNAGPGWLNKPEITPPQIPTTLPTAPSLPHLIETITGLNNRGIGFKSITEAIDTTTSGGKLIFHIFGALAEFERDIIRERTQAGLNAARARGRKGGRPKALTPKKAQQALTLYNDKNLQSTRYAQLSIYREQRCICMLTPEKHIPNNSGS
jgi:hypothetical protein